MSVRSLLISAASLACFAMAAQAQNINYATANLKCTFTHRCSGAQVNQYLANPRDFSQCSPVKSVVVWNTKSQTLAWDGKSRRLADIRQRRVGLTIHAITSNATLRFATGRKSASVLVSGPDGKLTDYYDGLCKEVS